MSKVCACSDYFTVNDDGELCLIPGRQGLRFIVYFKEPGNHQFEKADYPWLSRVKVRVQAGGGGSAGARAAANQFVAQPGGAGGGYSEGHYSATTLGAVETVIVGAGGDAGTATTDGGNGGNSAFGGLVTANGGGGGPAVMPSGTTPICYSGVAGPLAGSGHWAMGGGGSGGPFRLTGGEGQSGHGGDSHLGHGGFQRASSGGGGAPRGYGGGAGGSVARDGDSVNGTAGGSGLVILELYG